MVIHAVFMIDPEEAKPEEATALLEARCRCLQAAEDAIDLIYSTFRTDSFFQSWYVYRTFSTSLYSSMLMTLQVVQLHLHIARRQHPPRTRVQTPRKN